MRFLTAPYVLASLITIMLFAPMVIIVVAWLPLDISHEFSYFFSSGLVGDYALNSIVTTVSTVLASTVIGVTLAWAVTMVDFPLRRVASWMLIVPLAIPSYIAAMVYGDLLDSAGIVQYSLRHATAMSYGDYPFPAIRSIGGMIFILTLTLYPYIYIAARAAFITQSQQMLETAQLLGCSVWQLFWRVMIPTARPAIAAGAAIVGMEALADYGVASLYGVPVLTTGIFRAWHGYYDPITAARLASLLFVFVIICIALERYSRKGAKYHNVTGLYHPLNRFTLHPALAVVLTGLCVIVMTLGALLPISMLCVWASKAGMPSFNAVAGAFYASSLIGVSVASICIITGVFFAYFQRYYASAMLRSITTSALSGYALPGTVVAVGVLVVCIMLQRVFFDGAPLLTASLAAVIFGCVVRFVTVSFNNVNASLRRITPTMDDAAIMLGYHQSSIMKKIHIPMMKGALYSSFLLVFIDTVKELPTSLLLRPYNMTTLAIKSFELAKDDKLHEAAPLALLLIALSVLPVMMLSSRLERSRPSGVA
jgi:iron(III) transport system permease protein